MDASHQTPWFVRVKDDALLIRIGSESIRIEVKDGLTDDVSLLTKTIHERTQECLRLRRTQLDRDSAARSKTLREDLKHLSNIAADAFRQKKEK